MDRASEKEMEAAQALLELGREMDDSDGEHKMSQSTLPRVIDAQTDTDSDSDTDSKYSVETEYSKTSNFSNSHKKISGNQVCGPSNKVIPRRRSFTSNSSSPSTSSQEDIVTFYDQGTQTDESTWLPPTVVSKLEYMERIFESLKKRIGVLAIQVNNSNDDQGGERLNPNKPRVRRMSVQSDDDDMETVNGADLVPIGNGNAKVPARLLNDIDWNSYTSATRRLLQAIFPRRVLATHSLTGKQSPAFLNRPPKEMLDPQLVDDIVKTVSRKCGVPKNLVRNSITIKCSDEAKLYRNRQQQNQDRRPLRENGENVPPSNVRPQRTHRRPF